MVALLSLDIAQRMQRDKLEVQQIFMAAMLHDMGAVGLSERFDLLTFEAKAPHVHGLLGASLLEMHTVFKPLKNLVKFHHVSWRHGRGERFRGEAVPKGAHIIHLADRIAISLEREQPVAQQKKEILATVQQHSGQMFWPEAVQAAEPLFEDEDLWNHLISPEIAQHLANVSPLPSLELSLADLLDLSRFFSTIIDARSPATTTHSSGVGLVAFHLAKKMDLSPDDCMRVEIAGHLHSIGQLAIPEAVLEEQATMAKENPQVIKTLSKYTKKVFSRVQELGHIVSWAACNDPRQSQQGCSGESMGTRIVAVAEAFTTLTEAKPFRRAMPKNRCERLLKTMVAGKDLDAQITDVLLQHYDELDTLRAQAQKQTRHRLCDFWRHSKSE
ncbi:HD-GYP domain-containing protein [Magnetococcales bacterium HHB-1]